MSKSRRVEELTNRISVNFPNNGIPPSSTEITTKALLGMYFNPRT